MIRKLINLETLDVQNNQIHSLPKKINRLKALQILALSNNPLPPALLADIKASMPWLQRTDF